MTLLLNFITALAWIWGVITGLGFIAAMGMSDHENAADALKMGIFAWAWLIARYCL